MNGKGGGEVLHLWMGESHSDSGYVALFSEPNDTSIAELMKSKLAVPHALGSRYMSYAGK